jgi:vacuolar-type H+-ATPase subunit I/STV1
LTNLPTRVRDLVVRPYPWQLANASQCLGAIGTLLAYAILMLLMRYAWLSRGAVFARAAPALYPLLFMLVAYSLSVGNAGTGFRYRSHLVTLAIAAMVILREHALRAPAAAPEAGDPGVGRTRVALASRMPARERAFT